MAVFFSLQCWWILAYMASQYHTPHDNKHGLRSGDLDINKVTLKSRILIVKERYHWTATARTISRQKICVSYANFTQHCTCTLIDLVHTVWRASFKSHLFFSSYHTYSLIGQHLRFDLQLLALYKYITLTLTLTLHMLHECCKCIIQTLSEIRTKFHLDFADKFCDIHAMCTWCMCDSSNLWQLHCRAAVQQLPYCCASVRPSHALFTHSTARLCEGSGRRHGPITRSHALHA